MRKPGKFFLEYIYERGFTMVHHSDKPYKQGDKLLKMPGKLTAARSSSNPGSWNSRGR